MDTTPTGYSPTFLPVPVPFPTFEATRDVRVLSYVHFTVLQDPARRRQRR
jgi:endonuclease G